MTSFKVGKPCLNGTRPDNVGILAIELYTPSQYIDQSELETFDKVSPGKYTVGIGLSKMGFCSDREDINSLSMTVVQRLMEKNQIPYENIGRLEVGTETIIDKSKSVKTSLMQLFEVHGNTDIEGVDTINACYGGTSALFNSIAWVESSAWDGRYALVVCGDIAVYASGNARCTGGAGSVAMLVGPNAPLVFDKGMRSSFMSHAWDFYKPDLASEYPVVDGKLSIQCYFKAVDKCYQGYCKKADTQLKKRDETFSVEHFDAIVFHAPYSKLVQKSFARLLYNDFLRNSTDAKFKTLEEFKNVKLEDTYINRPLEQTLAALGDPLYKLKTEDSLHVAKEVGNMYTASLYGCLVSYLGRNKLDQLLGKKVGMFSYGSGLASTLFSLKITNTATPELRNIYDSAKEAVDRLAARKKMPCDEFDKTMKLREDTHNNAPYVPVGSIDALFAGTWYLTEVDSMHRRKYERKPVCTDQNGYY